MTSSPCPRLFEAEAMRDGRLVGAERASFERHTTVCSACASEVDGLDALAEALRAGPSERVDELRVRRERTRLLGAFDRELLAPERGWGDRRRWLWPAAAAAVLFAVLVVHWRARPASQAARAFSAVVHADSTAVWSERTEGDRDEIVLEHGALWIHVDHGSGRPRLVVVLPDGELEDIGTTFTISAENGHTTRVAVQEGSVVLRVRGVPPVAIGSGEVWTPTAPVASASVRAIASSPPSPASGETSSPRAAPPPPLDSARPRDPSGDFREAMSALDRGDNCEAAAAFASFFMAHPRDPRAEDAAYLRVIAFQRCGDGSNTREAAGDYLRRYPAGFRRAEVEALAQ
jgi:hypothetical protein